MKIQLNARNGAHRFSTRADERILYAGLAQAIELPYECASGTCGTCKARLVSGEIAQLWPNAPGNKYLKSREEFLMCQCVARTDCTIEVANFVAPIDSDGYVPSIHQGEITQVERLTNDVLRIKLRIDVEMDYDAGQFAMLRFQGIDGWRAWSMANFSRGARELTFIVRRKPSGAVSELVFNEPCIGRTVEIFGPLGRAIFYPGLNRDILCIAGGSGIAGMLAILECAEQAKYFQSHRGNVFFGVRSAADAFLLQELSEIASRCGDGLDVTVALSNEPPHTSLFSEYPSLSFDSGYVHEVAQRKMQGQYQYTCAYLAGPPPSVDASVRMLLMARVTTDNIRYDKFS